MGATNGQKSKTTTTLLLHAPSTSSGTDTTYIAIVRAVLLLIVFLIAIAEEIVNVRHGFVVVFCEVQRCCCVGSFDPHNDIFHDCHSRDVN